MLKLWGASCGSSSARRFVYQVLIHSDSIATDREEQEQAPRQHEVVGAVGLQEICCSTRRQSSVLQPALCILRAVHACWQGWHQRRCLVRLLNSRHQLQLHLDGTAV
jgi:hypothetical protein